VSDAEPSLRASALAADETHVYLALSGSGEIVRVPVAGGTAVVVAAQAGVPGAIAVDDSFVYWGDRGGRRVLRIAKGSWPQGRRRIAPWRIGGTAETDNVVKRRGNMVVNQRVNDVFVGQRLTGRACP
jgi:hypothetical protein